MANNNKKPSVYEQFTTDELVKKRDYLMNHNKMGGYTSDINDITNIIETRKNQVGELPLIEKMTDALSKAPSKTFVPRESSEEETEEEPEKTVKTAVNNNGKKPAVINELKSIKDRDGKLGYLDLTEDLERILPGASEEERNRSRLNKIITGESRPISHTVKEGTAWTMSNIGLPLLAGFLKGGTIASKGAKGLKAINEASEGVKGVKGTSALIKNALTVGKEAVKETGKNVAEKKAQQKGKGLFTRLLTTGLDSGKEELENMAARSNLHNIQIAEKALTKYAPDLPAEMVKKYAKEQGAKAGAGTLGTVIGGGRIANMADLDYGKYNKRSGDEDDDSLRAFDPRLEIGRGRKTLQFFKSLIDMDGLDPRKYPMDLINNLIIQTNADAGIWNKKQLDSLGDDEKIKLVKDVMKGKYNDFEDVAQIMADNYELLTNMEEK